MKKANTVELSPAMQELTGIFSGWRIWLTLAWDDIRLRYRRSSLGPFWITLSMAVKIYFMGFLYAYLFQIDVSQYFPFLAAGIITWTSAASLISESSLIFIESESYLRNMKISYTHLILRMILRNFIIFGHNLLAYVPIIIYFASSLKDFHLYNMLLLLPNLLIITINLVLLGTILAIFGTRFRDMPLIIESLLQVVFFVTPIMWLPTLLPEKYQWLAYGNPCYHIVNAIRAPLIGQSVSILSYGVLALFTLFSFMGFCYLLNRCKYRIIFWL